MTAFMIAVAAIGVIGLVAAYLVHRRSGDPGPSVWELRAEIAHRAPGHPLGLTEAHAITQEHINCDAAECACLRAALRTRIFARVMTPTPQLHDLLFIRFSSEID